MEEQIKKFFTNINNEWNHFLWKMKDKEYKLYDETNNKPIITAQFTCPYIQNTFIQPVPYYHIKLNSDIILRDSQQKIMDKIYKNCEENIFCWLIGLPPWGGKTYIIMAILELLWVNAVIVTKWKLVEQTIWVIEEKMWIKVWRYDSKKKDIKNITVTTHKSFSTSYDKFWKYDLVLIDECHEYLTEQMFVALANTPATMMYWLSWTPSRKWIDERSMQKIYWPLLIDEDFEEYFVPIFTNLNYTNRDRYITESANYADLRTVMSEDLLRKEWQKKYILHILNTHKEKDIIIMTDRLEEANFYLDFLKNEKLNLVDTVNNVKLWNKIQSIPELMKSANSVKKAFKKRIVIVWQYKKIWTGFDHPPLSVAILFQSVKVRETVIQWVWRILRQNEEKDKTFVYFWNDMNFKAQREEKVLAMKEKFWEEVIINEVEIFSKKIQKCNILDTNLLIHINDFNKKTELTFSKSWKFFKTEAEMTTYVLWAYRKKWFQCYKIPDDSRWAKPYDADITTKKYNYPVEYKIVNWCTFNSKILRDVQYSNLKKKLENKNNFPLVGVYSKKTGELKYIPFYIIDKRWEITVKLFDK